MPKSSSIQALAWAFMPLALALGGCSKPGKVYDQSPAAAEAALVGSTMPDMVTGGALESAPATVNGPDVIWAISNGMNSNNSGQLEVGFRLVAHVEPEGQGSRITTDIRPATDSQTAAFAARKAELGGAINLLDAITREQVDSRLTKRPFNMQAIATALALAMPDLLPLLREQLNKTIEESDAAARDSMNGADSNEYRRPEDNAAPQDDTHPVDDTQPDNDK